MATYVLKDGQGNVRSKIEVGDAAYSAEEKAKQARGLADLGYVEDKPKPVAKKTTSK